MADIFRPARRLMGRAPSVRVSSPVLARYLDDLARQQRIADAAEDARKLDIHFGRTKPDDPLAGIGDDPIAEMVAATGAPRRMLEAADYNTAIESMMPSGPVEPFADVLRRNDRTRALVNSRLDRLAPEERAGSLGVVGRQAEADAAMRRSQAIESDMDLGTRLGLAAGAAALAGGFALKPGEDEVAAEKQAVLDAAAAAEDERLRRDYKINDFIRSSVDDIDLTENFEPEAETASVRQMLIDSADIARNLPNSAMDDSFQDLLEAGVYQLPSPEETIEMSPGPESPVGMNRDMEDLPAPQMRSVKALMAAGIPEGRAMAIIVKGSSMSPDEYRAVTGGRR